MHNSRKLWRTLLSLFSFSSIFSFSTRPPTRRACSSACMCVRVCVKQGEAEREGSEGVGDGHVGSVSPLRPSRAQRLAEVRAMPFCVSSRSRILSARWLLLCFFGVGLAPGNPRTAAVINWIQYITAARSRHDGRSRKCFMLCLFIRPRPLPLRFCFSCGVGLGEGIPCLLLT